MQQQQPKARQEPVASRVETLARDIFVSLIRMPVASTYEHIAAESWKAAEVFYAVRGG